MYESVKVSFVIVETDEVLASWVGPCPSVGDHFYYGPENSQVVYIVVSRVFGIQDDEAFALVYLAKRP